MGVPRFIFWVWASFPGGVLSSKISSKTVKLTGVLFCLADNRGIVPILARGKISLISSLPLCLPPKKQNRVPQPEDTLCSATASRGEGSVPAATALLATLKFTKWPPFIPWVFWLWAWSFLKTNPRATAIFSLGLVLGYHFLFFVQRSEPVYFLLFRCFSKVLILHIVF